MAWFLRLRPFLADPPAESPSTKKISLRAGFFSWQSANLPGKEPDIKTDFLLISRAFLAASRALEAATIFSQMA